MGIHVRYYFAHRCSTQSVITVFQSGITDRYQYPPRDFQISAATASTVAFVGTRVIVATAISTATVSANLKGQASQDEKSLQMMKNAKVRYDKEMDYAYQVLDKKELPPSTEEIAMYHDQSCERLSDWMYHDRHRTSWRAALANSPLRAATRGLAFTDLHERGFGMRAFPCDGDDELEGEK